MFNIKIAQVHADKTYMESPQNNPMKWQWMYRSKNTLTAQAGKMKCKDFFNDLVAVKHGHFFYVYGLATSADLKFNRYGLYVLLTDVLADTIIRNIETAINPRMKDDLGCVIKCWKQSNTEVVIRLPLKVFDSTYITSLTTMLIRLSNYDTLFDSFDDFFTPKSALDKTEHNMSLQARRLAKHFGFKVPKNEWYFSSDGYQSSGTKPANPSIVHNNGISDWARALGLINFTY